MKLTPQQRAVLEDVLAQVERNLREAEEEAEQNPESWRGWDLRYYPRTQGAA